MTEVLDDALHVSGEDAGHEVEADQVVVRLILTDLCVRSPIVHPVQTASFHQAVQLEAHLTLEGQNSTINRRKANELIT